MGVRRITEQEVLLPALLAIYYNPGIRMDAMIKYLEVALPLSDIDRSINASRKDSKFSQIVRNLVSHRDYNKFGEFVRKVGVKNSYFELNKDGMRYLGEVLRDRNDSFNASVEENGILYNTHEPVYETLKLAEVNNRVPCLVAGNGLCQQYVTKPQIIKAVLSENDYKCMVDAEHRTFLTRKSLPYMEGHHLIPMAAQPDFKELNIDRSENICCLCPTCHRAIHYGNGEEKRSRLLALYTIKVEGLKKVKLGIEFDELVYKYYL